MSTPRFLAACPGSLDASTRPKGVSTLTCSPSCVTRVRLAMCRPTKVSATTEKIPIRARAPATNSRVLRPLLPVGAGVAGAPAVDAADMRAGAAAAVMGVPHLLQKPAPSPRVAPQELQNAIHSPSGWIHLEARV